MNGKRRERLVVIGNGTAGMRTVEELIARAPERYDITIIGAEPQANYNRILLSSVLAGEKSAEKCICCSAVSRPWTGFPAAVALAFST